MERRLDSLGVHVDLHEVPGEHASQYRRPVVHRERAGGPGRWGSTDLRAAAARWRHSYEHVRRRREPSTEGSIEMRPDPNRDHGGATSLALVAAGCGGASSIDGKGAATCPGAWAFHCHILPHVEGPEGMFGMVTALVVS